ncbi:MAG: hypothetical protein ACREO5_12255 [Candidatus Binatia bacterium]
MQSFTSIPFKTDDGLWHAKGIAKFSGAGVVLEFESKLLGLIGGGVKEIRIPLADLLDVRFRKGVFKANAKIEIRTKSFSTLAALPNKDGKLTLKLARDDYRSATDAVAKLQKDMAEHAAGLPPTHTSVSSLFDGSEDETLELNDE